MGPLVQRDPGQRERERERVRETERREKARKRNETEGLRQGRKGGQEEREEGMDGENYTAFRGN